jgi:hypothetical protein
MIKYGTADDAGRLLRLPLPRAHNPMYVPMGGLEVYNFSPDNPTGFSAWTDSVGPCHAVFAYAPSPAREYPLGYLGLTHVSGNHDLIMWQADALFRRIPLTHRGGCEIFIIGGDTEGEASGHTVYPERFDELAPDLRQAIKLVMSPMSYPGVFLTLELTGERLVWFTQQSRPPGA